jgi:hypothetical protein
LIISENSAIVRIDHPIPGEDKIQGTGLVPSLFEAMCYRLIASLFHDHNEGVGLQSWHPQEARRNAMDRGV